MRFLTPVIVLVLGCHEAGLPNRYGGPGGGYGGGGGANGHPSYSVDGGGAGGFGGTCSVPQENDVAEQGPTPAAITGGTVVALRGGGFVIADPDRARIWLVSADFKQIRSAPLNAGDDPGRVIEGADGIAYVSLRRAGQVAEVDFAAGTLRRLTTCELPRGLAWKDSRLIVACLGGALETIDPISETRAPILTSTPLSDLRDVVVDGDRLLVTRWRSAAILSIAANGAVTQLPTEAVNGMEPHVAWRAVARAGGGAAIVRQQHRTTQLTPPPLCVGYYGGAQANSIGLRDVVESEVLTVTGTTAVRISLTNTVLPPIVLPVDVASSPSGRLAIVSAGTGFLSFLEPGQRRDIQVWPHEVDTQLTSVVFVGESAFVFARQPATVFEVLPDGSVAVRATLGGEASISTGHEIFHRATGANIACASCHPEAGEDGHVWPFLEGARRTPTLRGGIGGTAPFHWNGDLQTMAGLMSTVMVERMRGPQLSSAGVQSLEDWLTLQPALPAPHVDGEAVARGAAVFTSAGCTACHAGAQGTNNSTVNVGTGQAFQVPRLVEFAWRGPWFHDGRMHTLEDRFSVSAGGAAHGDTDSLTPEQRSDLLVYLRSR